MTRSEAFEKLRQTFSSNSEPRHLAERAHKFQWVWGSVDVGLLLLGRTSPPPSRFMRCPSYLRRRVRAPSRACAFEVLCLCVTSPHLSGNRSQMCRTGTGSDGTPDRNAVRGDVRRTRSTVANPVIRLQLHRHVCVPGALLQNILNKSLLSSTLSLVMRLCLVIDLW